MQATGSIAGVDGSLLGVLKQLANLVAGTVTLPPIGSLPRKPVGDVFEPLGRDARAGANLLERLAQAIGLGGPRTKQTPRLKRPLLTDVQVRSPGDGTVTRIRFDAHAPGSDWGAPGRTSAPIAVYIDGRYHSTVLVMRERTGGYSVNMGALPVGPHLIELRSGAALAGPAAPAAKVSNLRAEQLSGEQAEVERHAPIIELRDAGATAGTHSSTHSDAPLLLVPSITTHADGTRTIAYRVLFSNEDGGTPVEQLFSRYGRGVDCEVVYRVHLAANGSVLGEQYQAPVHTWLPFDGEHEGSRPLLRISTANNMVSARVHAEGAERWSDAALAPTALSTTDTQVMRANPWTWAIMGKELLREGKATAGSGSPPVRDGQHVADARRFLYLGTLADTARAAIALRGGVEVVLANGRLVLARAIAGFASGDTRTAALELPDGATGDAVRGVTMLGIDAMVLDAAFRPRAVTAIAELISPR